MRNRKLLKTMVLGALACGLSLSMGVAHKLLLQSLVKSLLPVSKPLGMIWLSPIG